MTKIYIGDPTNFPLSPKPSDDPNPWANRKGNPARFPIEAERPEAPASDGTNTEELR